MKKVKTPNAEAIRDGIRAETERQQLRPSGHPMLPSRQRASKTPGVED
jgi:hypothetical protein